MTKREEVERLEQVGRALYQAASTLREARQRFAVRDDLSARVDAAEEEARMLSGEIATRLRDLDEAAAFAAAPAARRRP